MSVLGIDIADVEKLQNALKEYQGDAENSINEVLHNEGGTLIQNAIKELMPMSGKNWSGKAPAAKSANSLRSINENLAVTVKTQTHYGYLYFPDDGSNTQRHTGNQHFFERGGEAAKDEIIERCINKLTSNF